MLLMLRNVRCRTRTVAVELRCVALILIYASNATLSSSRCILLDGGTCDSGGAVVPRPSRPRKVFALTASCSTPTRLFVTDAANHLLSRSAVVMKPPVMPCFARTRSDASKPVFGTWITAKHHKSLVHMLCVELAGWRRSVLRG